MESFTIDKLEAAKRQLETAILLFFDRGDPVAIHTLACAAYDIIDGVNQHRGGKEMWVKRRYTQLPGRLSRADLNESQNFFKHGDKDPEGTLEFFPDFSLPLLADACETYCTLTNARPPLFEIMLRWFHCYGGEQQFDWPPDKHTLRDELRSLFTAGDRAGFLARCLQP